MDIVANFLWIFMQVCILITEGTIFCVNANRVQWLNKQDGTNTCLYFNRNAGKKDNMDLYFLPSENCCY